MRLSGRQEGLPEELATAWELHLALPIRAEPIVPHPLKTTRQDMQEKASNEFARVEGHEALTIAALVILPPERHLTSVTGEEPPMRDGHTMRVAGQGAQHPLWSGQRRLGVDHPLRLLQSREKLVPGSRDAQAVALPLQAQTLLDSGLPQRGQECAPKQPTEDTHWQEEALGTGDPGRAIQREASRGDQAMDVRMMVQRLTPSMQDPEKADLGA